MMLVNVYVPSMDKHFSIEVDPNLTLDDFKAQCSAMCGINPKDMKVFLNSQPLTDKRKTLKAYNVVDHDMFLVQQAISPSSLPNPFSAGPSPPKLPNLDFSNIQVPTNSSSTLTAQPRAQSRQDFSNPQTLRQWFLNNPHDLALLKERNPAMAESIEKGDLQKLQEQFQQIRDAAQKAEEERIRLLNADPMDLEVQKKIAEEIERKNIEDNMNMAIEEAPESFGQVVMLWINLKVNGHCVKAFVDSGAQMTIMSKQCAERCNIMRLVDKRWAGIAKGVGTQKILGRIHLAQIQIEDVYLQCSFSVLEDQPMDVLLGLDMLRRHLCVIDLRDNSLMIGTSKTKTKFLGESELPSHGRLHDPNNSTQPQTSTSKYRNEEEEINKAILESAAEALDRNSSSSTNGQTSASRAEGEDASARQSSPADFNDKVRQLMEMGFKRSQAESELGKTNGDLQLAISNLLQKAAGI